MKLIEFDFRDLKLPEIILYGIVVVIIYSLFGYNSFLSYVAIFYLIFEITIRRFEIRVRNLKEEGSK